MVSTRKKKYKSPPRDLKCKSISVEIPVVKSRGSCQSARKKDVPSRAYDDHDDDDGGTVSSRSVGRNNTEITIMQTDSHTPGEKKNDDDDENNPLVSILSSHCSIDVDDTELFVIDKHGGSSSFVMDCDMKSFNESLEKEDEVQVAVRVKKKKEKKKLVPKKLVSKNRFTLASKIKCPLDIKSSLYITFPGISSNKTTAHFHSAPKKLRDVKQSKEMEVMKKSVLTSGFEKLSSISAYSQGKRQGKRERRAERSKTKGDKWFNMAAPEVTTELKNDLSVLHMRRALDPKRFYKGNDTQGLPKYFQMGKVVETSADFYHARIPKKQRKANIVEELLADAEFRNYNKRKYTEIQEKKMRQSRGAYKHMKRLKKRSK